MHDEESGVSFKSLFVPFTATKAIHYLILVGIIVFANALFNGFIADDNGQILDNQLVHSISNFFTFFTTGSFSGGGSGGAGIYYKPLFSTVLSSIYSAFGPVPFFFHVAQLLLHIVNASLVFYLFSKILHKPLAFFLALIFLVHPINAESVIYISDMQETLFFFFGIVSLVISTQKDISLRTTIFVHVLLFLSILSKETGILFLFISLVYTYLFQRKNVQRYLLLSVCVIIIYSFLRFLIAGIYFNKDILNPIMDATLAERLLSIPAILHYYISTFFFPKELLFNQQWVVKYIDTQSFTIPLLIVTLFFGAFLLVVSRLIKIDKQYKSYTFFFVFWFLSGILLHLQLFPLDATVADRWFYFPIIGLLGIIGLFAQVFYMRWKFPQKKELVVILMLIIVTSLSIRTIVRNTNWHNPITLYLHDIPLMKPNFSLENALAYEYFKINDKDNALRHAERSVEIYPTFVNLTNLGAIQVEIGELEKGKMSYERAIEKGSSFHLAYENMTLLLIKQNDFSAARNFVRKATEIFPISKKLWFYRIVAEYKYGDNERALYAAEKYYLLSNTQESYDIYVRLKNKQPLNIEMK